MQINRVNLPVSSRISKQQAGSKKNNINNRNTLIETNNTAQSGKTPSFKSLDGFCLGVANAIENGGLVVSFTLQDMLGTNLPRPVMGLMRNRNENGGEKNISFALKELVREMLTGPSMFLIPMGMLAVGEKLFGKTINIPTRQLRAFGEIHAQNADIQSKKEFYEKTFEQIFRNSNFKKDEAIKKAKEYAEELSIDRKEIYQNALKRTIQSLEFEEKIATETAGNAAEKLIKKNDIIGKLSEDFVRSVKSHADDAVHTDFTKAVLSDNSSASFKEIVNNMMNYADEVIEKTKGKSSEVINQVASKKIMKRVATNTIMYAAVLAFLTLIPKLYNKAEGEGNSGLKGLMKEETLNDKSLETLNTKTSQPTETSKASEISKNTPNTKTSQNTDKSNPSFGSTSGMQKLSSVVTQDIGIGKFFRGFEFEGCNVSFPMLLGIMGLGILLPRTLQAKDDYDREEILRRDLVTCAAMCFGEKTLQKAFSKVNEVNSGLVLATKSKDYNNKNFFQRLFEYIRPIKGVNVMSTEQIVAKYSDIDSYKDKIFGFCEFIDKQGGQLNKILGGNIDDKAPSLLMELLDTYGDKTSIKDASNANIIETLRNACKDTKGQKKVQKLTDRFNGKENAWVQRAKKLNARFTTLSVCLLVPVFLGFMLPAINERATKKRIREEEKNKTTKIATTPIEAKPVQQKLLKETEPSKIFKGFQA